MTKPDLSLKPVPSLFSREGISYLVISDIHFFHDRTKTQSIIDHLDVYFHHYGKSILSQLAMVVIPGDLFDQPMEFSCDEVDAVCHWLLRLMHFCHRNNILLRIMEGTRSHDSKQSKITRVLEAQTPGLNFRYISDIEVEKIDSLGISILYIPDSVRETERVAFSDACKLMAENGLEKVDLTFTHGMYERHATYGVNPNRLHFESDYLAITRHYVHNGHIHTPTLTGRVLDHGSFDRLKHNEEHPKGGVIAHIYSDPSRDHFSFYENTLAQKYVRVYLRNTDIESCLKKIDKVVDTLPASSYVEICAKSLHPLMTGFSEVRARYPTMVMTKNNTDEEKDKKSAANKPEQNTYIPMPIDAGNIVSVIMANLNTKLDDTQVQELTDTLKELL